jgi:hypothetical protein
MKCLPAEPEVLVTDRVVPPGVYNPSLGLTAGMGQNPAATMLPLGRLLPRADKGYSNLQQSGAGMVAELMNQVACQ